MPCRALDSDWPSSPSSPSPSQIDGFLSLGECSSLQLLAAPRLAPSALGINADGLTPPFPPSFFAPLHFTTKTILLNPALVLHRFRCMSRFNCIAHASTRALHPLSSLPHLSRSPFPIPHHLSFP
eukprot:211326-Rhodomonas_salina.1